MSNYMDQVFYNDIHHNLKSGDSMIKTYGNKEVNIKFLFEDKGEEFNDILERVYRESIKNEKILTMADNRLPDNKK